MILKGQFQLVFERMKIIFYWMQAYLLYVRCVRYIQNLCTVSLPVLHNWLPICHN